MTSCLKMLLKVMRNYMNNSLLYVVHLCTRGSERGSDNVLDDELFEDAAEGHATEMGFGLARMIMCI